MCHIENDLDPWLTIKQNIRFNESLINNILFKERLKNILQLWI